MEGLVRKNQNGYFYLINSNGEQHIAKVRGLLKRGRAILVGDRVDYRVNPDGTATILSIYPRKSEFFRPPIANIDELVVTASISFPDFNQFITDTMLAISEHAGVRPVLCITKSDLMPEGAKRIVQEYEKAGYAAFAVSIWEPNSIAALKETLHGRIIAFTGPSGAGKSSLINQLLRKDQFISGIVSKKTKRGKNTTRHAELVPFKGCSFIMDTPGYTSLNAWSIDATDLSYCFSEFRELSSQCRFNDCCHLQEPDCAIRKAVEEGRISSRRYESYQCLYNELNNNK